MAADGTGRARAGQRYTTAGTGPDALIVKIGRGRVHFFQGWLGHWSYTREQFDRAVASGGLTLITADTKGDS